MLNAKATQFSLSDDGHILWQASVNNPLPGVAIAKLEKGKSALTPTFKLLDVDVVKALEQAAVIEFFEAWLKTHIATVLEPLVALADDVGEQGAVAGISAKVYEALGVLPRGQIEDLIAQLDPETRRDLRAKKIKLGPILVFIPALNKPAAVRLKALLWTLFEGKALPSSVPPDGVVSYKVEDADADQAFYRAVGYPLYGGRAIRIDMLDRVICSIYDQATGGKFQAKHEMAEWLGSSIECLYSVLEAMGHKKISDPADDVKVDEAPETEIKAPGVDGKETQPEEAPKPDVKPELAIFRLKKGKASEKESVGAKTFKKPDAKPYKKKAHKKPPVKKKPEPRVMEALSEANPDDNPFAVLQQLKNK